MGTIQLTEHQKKGLLLLEKSYKENPISCLSGYAGTGKSTIIGEFVKGEGILLDQVLYLTFTGKASTVLQSKGLPSMTIHSALYSWTIENINGKPKFVATKRVPSEFPNLKLIVIDEISMVNDELLTDIIAFVSASESRIKLICLGDIGQLPPVETDKSIISQEILKNSVFNLEEFMRFSESSGIYELADRVRKGLPLKVGEYNGCKVTHNNTPKLLRKFLRDNNSQILVTTNKTRMEINKFAREMLGYDNIIPRVHEKVIFTRNNRNIISSDYKFPIMNGIIGTINEIYSSHTLIHGIGVFKTTIDYNGSMFKNIWVDADNFLEMENGVEPELDLKRKLTYVNSQEENFIPKLNTLDFAYGITVHKSQGSEFENVLFYAEKWGSPKFIKQLLYTGITRATKHITIVI